MISVASFASCPPILARSAQQKLCQRSSKEIYWCCTSQLHSSLVLETIPVIVVPCLSTSPQWIAFYWQPVDVQLLRTKNDLHTTFVHFLYFLLACFRSDRKGCSHWVALLVFSMLLSCWSHFLVFPCVNHRTSIAKRVNILVLRILRGRCP